MSQLAQQPETATLLFTPHKGHPKRRGRHKTEHAAQRAFWGACLYPPSGLAGAHSSIADPVSEAGLSSEKAEGSSRERELRIIGTGIRRQDTSISSSEKGEELVRRLQ